MTKLGLTRNKAILIGVLSIALAYVLFGQPADPEGAATESAPVAEQGTTPSLNPEPAAKPATSWTPSWPNVSLEETLARNPFAPLEIAAEPKPAETPQPAAPIAAAPATSETNETADADAQDAVAEFQRLGVTMILKNKSKTCAVVGGRLVHAGDVVNGVRIVTITAREVIVEPVAKGR